MVINSTRIWKSRICMRLLGILCRRRIMDARRSRNKLCRHLDYLEVNHHHHEHKNIFMTNTCWKATRRMG
jgi:hypothetical protein